MTAMTPLTRRSGLDLKVERTKRDVKLIDLAKAMGRQASSVSRLESSRRVTDKAAAAYLEALATFPTVTTDAEPPQAA